MLEQCARCAVQARAQWSKPGCPFALWLCAHHSRQHGLALRNAGWALARTVPVEP